MHNAARFYPILESFMAVQRTFSIIKPDATRRNLTGKVNAVIEDAGLRIVAQKRIRLSDAQARNSMKCTRNAPSSASRSSHMTAEPVVVQVLEGENAIAKLSRSDGLHQPQGCRRRHHPQAVRHCRSARIRCMAPTAPENAQIEIAQFFTDSDIPG